jgi:xanthine dehydrogenase accessory factor
MDSVDLEVLHAAASWSQDGAHVLLATVVRTWGSAPRPAGSMMVIREDGHIRGSISGGCIEDELIRQVQSAALRLAKPQALTYGISAEEAHRFGLPCGGTLQIVIEPVSPASQLPALLAAIRQHRLMTRVLDLETGAVRLTPGSHAGPLSFDGMRLTTVHGPRFRLVIIGAAQITRYVAGIAQSLDYEVIVCDPRREYLDEWDLAGVTLSDEMPDDLLLRLQPDAHSAVVALTHDPKLDDLALLEALKSPAFYVGAIGSRANNMKRRARLRLFDITDAEIDRLHGPVGLDLGARTPPEIAVAILAEMTAVRNGVPVRKTHAIRPGTAAEAAQGCVIS